MNRPRVLAASAALSLCMIAACGSKVPSQATGAASGSGHATANGGGGGSAVRATNREGSTAVTFPDAGGRVEAERSDTGDAMAAIGGGGHATRAASRDLGLPLASSEPEAPEPPEVPTPPLEPLPPPSGPPEPRRTARRLFAQA